MFNRPALIIAIVYALIIISLRPLIPVPEKSFNQEKPDIPIITPLSQRFISVIQKTTPVPYDSLFGSIVFGSGASPLDPELKDRYKKVGLAHLLVASGTQVSILIGTVLAIFRFFRMPISVSVFIASIFNIVFALIAGCGASIVRAGIMGQIVLTGKLFNKDADIYTSLSIAALILMIFDPLIIFDIGFQLTFGATWALVYLCPILEEKGIPSLVSVSLSPIIVTLPITFYNFNQISIAALPVNLLVVPWVEVLTVMGFVSTFLGAFFLPIAEILNFSLSLILKILNGIVYTFSDIPISCVYFSSPPFILVFAYYVCLIVWAEKLKGNIMFKIKKSNILIALLFLVLFSVWSVALAPGNLLEISIIDVKQGDSIFIKTPDNHTMLIDAGPKFRKGDAGKSFVIPFLHKKGINKIDVLVLTHPHDDHVGGACSVLKEIPVGMVIDSGQPHTSKAYMEFLQIIGEKKIPYKLGRAGQEIGLGEGVRVEILNPTEPFIEESALNNNSVVIRLEYRNFSMLFMGDAEKEAENRILQSVEGRTQSIGIKVGHHGSKTSSSIEFLKAVKPKFAVISVGAKNKFFHPHPSALKRLEQERINVFRTDQNGTIVIKSDGKTYDILPEK